MSDDLVTWLRAQLDEDERIAGNAPCSLNNGDWPFWVEVVDNAEYESAAHYRDQFPPKLRLREVEAKREMLEVAESSVIGWTDGGEKELGREILRLLALPYADRPGYRAEWAP
jgi:Family of unknown function (DUF6221)